MFKLLERRLFGKLQSKPPKVSGGVAERVNFAGYCSWTHLAVAQSLALSMSALVSSCASWCPAMLDMSQFCNKSSYDF